MGPDTEALAVMVAINPTWKSNLIWFTSYKPTDSLDFWYRRSFINERGLICKKMSPSLKCFNTIIKSKWNSFLIQKILPWWLPGLEEYARLPEAEKLLHHIAMGKTKEAISRLSCLLNIFNSCCWQTMINAFNKHQIPVSVYHIHVWYVSGGWFTQTRHQPQRGPIQGWGLNKARARRESDAKITTSRLGKRWQRWKSHMLM